MIRTAAIYVLNRNMTTSKEAKKQSDWKVFEMWDWNQKQSVTNLISKIKLKKKFLNKFNVMKKEFKAI